MPTSPGAGRTLAASPSVPDPSPARVWWSAARPATLAASVSPVLAGVAEAAFDGRERPAAGLGALVVALAIQLGVNFANDYSDHRRGTDRERVGPVRAASSGVVAPNLVMVAALASFAVAAVAGLWLSLATDPRLLIAGAAAIAAGWLYTGGPRPYGYLGLGEVFTFVFFGLMATLGTVYVMELRVPGAAFALAGAMGFLSCAILAVNNLRDIDTDRAAGKRTLAVLLGRRATRVMIAVFLALALALIALFAYLTGRPWVLLTLGTVPLGASIVRATGSSSPRHLVDALRRTAAMEMLCALGVALGLML